MLELENCPFCGMQLDVNDHDTLHKSGIYWRTSNRGREYIGHRERLPSDEPCYVVVCNVSYGGCGAEMHKDSPVEAISAWNRRV